MEEDANSWLRRTKFSHTVCHRLDSLKYTSVPINFQPDRNLEFRSRPQILTSDHNLATCSSQIYQKPKQRSPSPLPKTIVSNEFKEAQSDRKRFLSPCPRGKAHEMPKIENTKSSDLRSLSSMKLLQHFASNKGQEKSKPRKESGWNKYFDYGGGRVTAVEAADEFSVDLSKLFLGLRFAHGAHSRLYHGVYKDEPVAVKIIRIPDDDEYGVLGPRLQKQYSREVSLLSRLNHPNVIKFTAACREPPVYCIITEYLQEGSLRAHLHKRERKPLPLQKLIQFSLDISQGMEFIHSQGLIHRDLKPENVLIDREFHLKVADFGIACEEAYCDALADDPGTYRWMAPEMIKHKSYGRKVDVYSFGLILWEMVAGAIPYEDMTPIQAAFAVVNKNLRPVIPDSCPHAMRALIEQCWSVEPEKRPEFWLVVKVLEQFERSLAHDGTLNLVQNPSPSCHDHKKRLLQWIQKLGGQKPFAFNHSAHAKT